MNELEKAAEKYFLEKYGNQITASESWVIRFATEFGQSDAAKQYHTKEAMELIEELNNKLKTIYYYYNGEISAIDATITKAENFLNNNK